MKFWEFIKKPLRIAVIATVLVLIDMLIGRLFVKGASFTWVAFVFWTVFFTSSIKDRIKALIGTLIGIASAILMMFITKSFNVSIYVISISTLLGVFVVNFLVMLMEKTKKIWTNSISGMFVGIALTFSGLGVGLNPINNGKDFSIMLAIIVCYAVLGLICGFFSICKLNKTNK